MKAVEEHSYDPETIELMRTVLDEAWGLLEPKQRASTNKTEIAVRILNFGSKADMATLIGDVRYTPKSGQRSSHALAHNPAHRCLVEQPVRAAPSFDAPVVMSSATRFRRGIVSHCRQRGVASMKMVAEYLEKALHFEQLAAAENDPELKASLIKQAEAYRKLAADRALRDKLILLSRPK